MADQVLVVYNPSTKSHLQDQEWMGQLVRVLNESGHQVVSFYPTTPQTQARDLIPYLVPSLKLVIVAGGDGSTRLTLAALALAHSPIPAALFPIGTGNVLARNLGIMGSALLANPLEHFYDYLINGISLRIDLGMMNGEYFAGMAGVGPFSDAFMTPKRREKTKGKLLAYIKALLASIPKTPRVFKITTSGWSFKIQAAGVFISNVEDLGIGKKPDFDAMRDGILKLRIIKPAKARDYVALFKRYGGGYLDDSDSFEWVFPVKEAVVEVIPRLGVPSNFQRMIRKAASFITGTPFSGDRRDQDAYCMIDGDQCGCPPMRVTVIPDAVTVLVPAQMAPDTRASITVQSKEPQENVYELRRA